MCDKAGLKGSMRKRGEFPSNFRRLLHYILIIVQCSTDEPMARVPKMAHGKLSLARDIHCSPYSFISFAGPESLYCEEYIYIYVYTHTHLSECVETVYELPLLPNNTENKTFF
jgi:hypothetical protein